MNRHSLSFALSLFIGLLPVLLAGCHGGRIAAANHPRQIATRQGTSAQAASANEAQQNLRGRVEGTGWHLRWETHKTANLYGPMVPLLVANAQKGSILYKGGETDMTLLLKGVYARLYEEGRYVADVQADTVIANQQQHTLRGEGHVRVLSRERPPNTLITADRMTWESDADRIVAEGNVHLVQFRGNSAGGRASTPYTTSAPRMVYHIATGEIVATQ
ncbi:hypothetical protein [Chthonomonas calidirosea]|uniref:hypothetical protein n=1 Tax=Chthonomonas calidirosea TaxID=454171 RepID=UPI0006EC7C4B|nr:hypothetical protein [Chthonomonas calidirosea]CEK18297.1 hypothetical protein CP488_02135 [Chthonomonas calidirosea]